MKVLKNEMKDVGQEEFQKQTKGLGGSETIDNWKERQLKKTKEELMDEFIIPLMSEKEAIIQRELLDSKKVGFDRVATDLRKKLEKLGRQKKVSSFSLIGKGGGAFSGGIVGDVGVLVEGLFLLAQKQPAIKVLMEISLEALESEEMEKKKKEGVILDTSVSRLQGSGLMDMRLMNILDENGILDLGQLSEVYRRDVMRFKGMGDKYYKQLDSLLLERGISYRRLDDGDDSITSIKKLLNLGIIPARIEGSFFNEGISDLKDLAGYKRREVGRLKGIGKGTLSLIDNLLKERNMTYKDGFGTTEASMNEK